MSLADQFSPLDLVPALPRPGERWTPFRKATVVGAVRGGSVALHEVCQTYSISVDEFLAWERDMDRYGIPGLRSTRFQIYRDTDKQRQDSPAMPPRCDIVHCRGCDHATVGVARWRWR